MAIQSFKELEVWKRSMELAKHVYRLTKKFPKTEQYGLSSQMQRAAVSIPSNIAEGYKRRGRRDYVRFLKMSDGSAAELETQLLLAKDVYPDIQYAEALSLLDEVQRMLTVLIRRLSSEN